MSKKKNRFARKATYVVGEDFTPEEYARWEAELAYHISQVQTNEKDPKAKARLALECAMNGTKLNGAPWPGVESIRFEDRIRAFASGYNILTGEAPPRVGRPRKKPPRNIDKGSGATRMGRATNEARNVNGYRVDQLGIQSLVRARKKFIATLYKEFPFLDNPVYENKVTAYADTVVKLEQLSDNFLGASGKELENHLKIRESLRKDLDEFMKMLRIHPSQVKEKVDEGDRGDVGSLIDKWEEYGELSEIYEQVDAIQEAIQMTRQLENVRMDGSPQLADYLLWHKTGCRGHQFKCECGREYDLHGGFTREEMFQIAEQAYEAYGYGIKRIDEDNQDSPRTEASEEDQEPVPEVTG